MNHFNNHNRINLFRALTRYFLAIIATSLIVGSAYYFYYQVVLSGKQFESHHYIYNQSWEEHCGLILSMLVLPVLIYALVKQFILRQNENYWINTMLLLVITIIFFGVIFSLTWGFNFSLTTFIFEIFLGISPFLIFPLFLRISKRIIKPMK
jgi:hypothetical protein